MPSPALASHLAMPSPVASRGNAEVYAPVLHVMPGEFPNSEDGVNVIERGLGSCRRLKAGGITANGWPYDRPQRPDQRGDPPEHGTGRAGASDGRTNRCWIGSYVRKDHRPVHRDVNQTGQNATDDGTTATLLANSRLRYRKRSTRREFSQPQKSTAPTARTVFSTGRGSLGARD